MTVLSRHYGGLNFRQTNAMNAPQRYLALENGDAQIIDACACGRAADNRVLTTK